MYYKKQEVRKLAEAQFDISSPYDVAHVWKAFASAFPSLRGVDANALIVLLNHRRDDAWRRAAKLVENQLAAASYGGEWPGSFTVIEKHGRYKEPEVRVIVTPYVGDRHFELYTHKGQIVARCDYNARPSLTAAKDVIEIRVFNARHYYVTVEEEVPVYPEEETEPLSPPPTEEEEREAQETLEMIRRGDVSEVTE